jgi:DNA polymerase (family 10)
MLNLPGLRLEKIMKLHNELGINSLAELEAATKQDRLRGVKGLDPALQCKVLAGPRGQARPTVRKTSS